MATGNMGNRSASSTDGGKGTSKFENATPTDLDPAFNSENVDKGDRDNRTESDRKGEDYAVTDKDRTPQNYTADERLRDQANGEISNVREDDQITYRQNVPDGAGGIKVIEHGPMPVSEWADYSREKGL